MYSKIITGTLVIPPTFSPELEQFVRKTVAQKPEDRVGKYIILYHGSQLGDDEIMKEPFFASIDWQKLERKELVPPWKPPKIQCDPIPYNEQLEELTTDDPFQDFNYSAPHLIEM
jgi:hypothetical protein